MNASLPRIIALSIRIYRWLLLLGPVEFRREYGEQAIQVFRQCCRDAYRSRGTFGVISLWPATFSEAIIEMTAEHLFPSGGIHRMLPTMRRSMIATFWAFVLFTMAYTALGHTTDPRAPFDAVGSAHPEVAYAYAIVSYSGEIALLAIALGGLPILFTAVKHAIPGGLRNVVKLFAIKPKQVLLLFGAALLITICFLGYLLATEFIFTAPSTTCQPGVCVAGEPFLLLALAFIALVAGITLFVYLILVITAAFSLAVLRSEFNAALLRFALVPIAMLTLVMGAATIAAAFWLIRLWMVAPQFATSPSGLGNGQTAWVVAIIAAMALATFVTASAFRNGFRSSRLSTV